MSVIAIEELPPSKYVAARRPPQWRIDAEANPGKWVPTMLKKNTAGGFNVRYRPRFDFRLRNGVVFVRFQGGTEE